jgi:hypothetical protein
MSTCFIASLILSFTPSSLPSEKIPREGGVSHRLPFKKKLLELFENKFKEKNENKFFERSLGFLL